MFICSCKKDKVDVISNNIIDEDIYGTWIVDSIDDGTGFYAIDTVNTKMRRYISNNKIRLTFYDNIYQSSYDKTESLVVKNDSIFCYDYQTKYKIKGNSMVWTYKYNSNINREHSIKIK